jgi:hypothetical protein
MLHHFTRHAYHGIIPAAGFIALLLLVQDTTQAGEQKVVMTSSVAEFFAAAWDGDTEQHLSLAENCHDLVRELSQLESEPGEVVRLLMATLDLEADAWVRFTCLLSLADDSSDPTLAPFMVHFLAEGRQADLWPVLTWLAENRASEALPHLEALRRTPYRAWLQPLLLQALARNSSGRQIEEFTHLAQAELSLEENLAGVAVHAPGMRDDESPRGPALRVTPDRWDSLRCWTGPGRIGSFPGRVN